MQNLHEEAMCPDPREEKLPVWARAKLRDLRNALTATRGELDRALLATHPDESVALLNPYGNVVLGTGPVGLGRDPQIRLLQPPIEGHKVRYVDVRVDSDGRRIVLMSGDGLMIRPISGNAAYVEDVRWDQRWGK